MTYVVTENCIRCKYMDCVEVCPVDCFYVGENMLMIHPDECIDCGVCEPECPAEAIVPDSDDRAAAWAEQNRVFAAQWPNITRKGTPPVDADEWKDKPGKAALFSAEPGQARALRVFQRPPHRLRLPLDDAQRWSGRSSPRTGSAVAVGPGASCVPHRYSR